MGAILKALYRISEGFWFSPSKLVMTALLHLGRGYSPIDAEVAVPGLRAYGIPIGAMHTVAAELS